MTANENHSDRPSGVVDRETTGILFGLGVGFIISSSISTTHTILVGSFCILFGIAYEIYQSVKIGVNNSTDATSNGEAEQTKSSQTDNHPWAVGKSPKLYNDMKKLDIRMLYLFQVIGVTFAPMIAFTMLYSIYSYYLILTAEIPVNLTTTLFYTTSPAPINSVAMILGGILYMPPILTMATAPVNAVQESSEALTPPEKQALSCLVIAAILCFTATYYFIENNPELVIEPFYLTVVFIFILITDIDRRNISVRGKANK